MKTDFKLVLYGDCGAGKTSIVTRLIRGVFHRSSMSTIGASYITWKPNADMDLLIGIWDTAGQERYAELIPMYLRKTDVVIFCWDNTLLFDMKNFKEKYNRAKHKSPSCLFYLVFTKIDKLTDYNEINKLTAEQIKKDEDIVDIFHTSSLTGSGVSELFKHVSDLLAERMPPVKAPYINLGNNYKYCCFN